MYRWISRLFGRGAVAEAVTTQFHFDASPEAVWNQMMLYEEVPGRCPWLLRLLLPLPVRTKGDKSAAGAVVHCLYNRGELIKRISAVERGRVLRFEVIRQRLGIEGCVVTRNGSYQITPSGSGARVALTTHYEASLRPRGVWRAIEKLLIRRLHRHILYGMSAALSRTVPATLPSPAGIKAENPLAGGVVCTPSHSPSHR